MQPNAYPASTESVRQSARRADATIAEAISVVENCPVSHAFVRFESVQSLPTVRAESAWTTMPTIGPIEMHAEQHENGVADAPLRPRGHRPRSPKRWITTESTRMIPPSTTASAAPLPTKPYWNAWR